MQLLEIPEHLEVCHLVADGRRTDAEVILARQCPRADRLCRLDVIIDNCLQHALLAFIKFILHLPAPFLDLSC